MKILDTKTKLKCGPARMRKAGAIVENMEGAGYDEEKIVTVCRCLVS